jgi:hypothetical protein
MDNSTGGPCGTLIAVTLSSLTAVSDGTARREVRWSSPRETTIGDLKDNTYSVGEWRQKVVGSYGRTLAHAFQPISRYANGSISGPLSFFLCLLLIPHGVSFSAMSWQSSFSQMEIWKAPSLFSGQLIFQI